MNQMISDYLISILYLSTTIDMDLVLLIVQIMCWAI